MKVFESALEDLILEVDKLMTNFEVRFLFERYIVTAVPCHASPCLEVDVHY
jgi:hypothetical protein